MAYLPLIYFIFLIAYGAYSVAGIYHLWRFGYVGDLTRPAIVLYCLASAGVILFSLLLIASRDWSGGFDLNIWPR